MPPVRPHRPLLQVCLLALFILWMPHHVSFAQSGNDGQPAAEDAAIDIYDPALADRLEAGTEDHERLAWQAYSAGEYERAASEFHLSLRTKGVNPDALYNLACCYALLGEADLASRYLSLSVDNGFSNAYSLQNDPDFAELREAPDFASLVEELVAQVEERRAGLGNQLFVPASTYHAARVVYPGDYSPSDSYRLLVALHGFGSSHESFLGLRERFNDPDFIMVCPQAPYPFSSSGGVGYSWAGWTNGGNLPVDSFHTSQAYVDEVISTMRRTHNISSVYLLGFSQGGMMSVYEALSSPEQVDGAIIFGASLWDFIIGEGLLSDHPGAVRWFIAHGINDTTVPFAEGEAMAEALRDAGHDVQWHEFEGAHAVPEEVLQVAEKWMKEGDQ